MDKFLKGHRPDFVALLSLLDLLAVVDVFSKAIRLRLRTISIQPPCFRPRIGVLGDYTDSNLDWVKAQGFTSMQLRLDPTKLDDAPILRNLRVDSVRLPCRTGEGSRAELAKDALGVSGAVQNADNFHAAAYFAKVDDVVPKRKAQKAGSNSGLGLPSLGKFSNVAN